MFIENNNASSTNNYTVPNQKTVIVHREMPVKDFLQIKNENWMEVNKKFTPYGLQVYLYLAKNKDGFNLALSQAAAEEEAGIKKTTFHKYINLFIAEGYLVKRSGNKYDFYETPRKQTIHAENENSDSSDVNDWALNEF